jgi:methylated-DNA-[protein]-cysteine S-methyltransferase
MQSPVGRLLLAGDDNTLKSIDFETGRHSQQPPADWRQDGRPLRAAMHQLDDYFAGKRHR